MCLSLRGTGGDLIVLEEAAFVSGGTYCPVPKKTVCADRKRRLDRSIRVGNHMTTMLKVVRITGGYSAHRGQGHCIDSYLDPVRREQFLLVLNQHER